MGNKIGVPVTQGLDVPNFFKDVPNSMKDVPNFVKDVLKRPKSILRWGTTFNHFLRFSKGIFLKCPINSKIGCTKFS